MSIVLIVMDTARACSFASYGYRRETTPLLEAFAQEGALYREAISSSPWTLPSHASMFTGMFPSKHGAHARHKYLDAGYPTLPEILRLRGYNTVGISNNSWVSPRFGFGRGFDDFIRIWQAFQTDTDLAIVGRGWETTQQKLRGLWGSVRTGSFVKNAANTAYAAFLRRRYDDGARRINREIKRWIHRQWDRKRPFFMFVNYREPHLRYHPPSPFNAAFLPPGVRTRDAGRTNQDAWSYIAGVTGMGEEDFEILRALYDGELAYLDHRIHEVVTFLREERLLDDTLVIITSDHGENIGDHDLMDHQYCLYDTLLRVPFVARYPPVFPPRTVIEDQVQLVDILPTVLDVLGIDDRAIRDELQGETLLPESFPRMKRRFAFTELVGPQPSMEAVRQRVPGADESALGRFDRSLVSIRGQKYKLICASDGKDELYDLVCDPGETDNRIGDCPEVAEELREVLATWKASFRAPEQGPAPEIDGVVRKRLEDLGYF